MTGRGPAGERSAQMEAALDLLRRESGRLFGAGAGIEPLTFDRRESSEITRARITGAGGDGHVFVKTLQPRRAGETAVDVCERLRHDVAITGQVRELLRLTPDLRAVETLLWDPGILCVVTREAEGVPLDRLTGRDARWPSSEPKLQGLERAMTRIGRWLARFQQLPAAGQAATVNLDDTREYIDARLRRLTAMPGAGFDERDRAAVLDYVDRRAGEVAAADLGEVAVHGDITPSNVVAGPESVTVLDFGMTARGSRYFDLSRLYTQLEFYTAKPQYRPAAMARLQNAAIAGFAPGLHADHPLFAIYAVQHVVCHYVSHARQPGAFPASLYSAHQCRRHRQWLRELARRPGTATPAAGGAAASAR